MGARGQKQSYTEISCPNEKCPHYGMLGKQNIVGNGTYETKTGTVRKYICRTCGRVFNDRTGTAYQRTHLTEQQYNLIVSCQANGVGVRRTAAIAECSPTTVQSVVRRAGSHVSKVSQAVESGGVAPEVLQFDELQYTLKKTPPGRGPFQRGRGLDLDLALCRREIPAGYVS